MKFDSGFYDDKLIFTIDIDSFFASAELARRPELEGLPIVVGDDINGRGVVGAANYIARDFGIHAGMPLFKAKKLCPQINIIPNDHDYYNKIANEFFKVVLSFTPKVQVASVDECYADVTHLMRRYYPIELAKIIQSEIFLKTGLSNSIGISTNIVLSKMASNIDKPYGIATLYKHEIKDKLWPMPIGKMHMIGAKSAEKFINHGIDTIGKLALLKNDFEKYTTLRNEMGIALNKLIDSVNGKSTDKVVVEGPQIKSVSKDKTFEYSKKDLDTLLIDIRKLFDIVTKRVNSRKLWPTTISVGIKVDKSLDRVSASMKLKTPTSDVNVTWPIVESLVEKLYKNGMSVRFGSVSFDGLRPSEKVYRQLEIGEKPKTKTNKLQHIVEKINLKSETEVVVASAVEDNIRYANNKDPLMSDNIKFKSWDK